MYMLFQIMSVLVCTVAGKANGIAWYKAIRIGMYHSCLIQISVGMFRRIVELSVSELAEAHPYWEACQITLQLPHGLRVSLLFS